MRSAGKNWRRTLGLGLLVALLALAAAKTWQAPEEAKKVKNLVNYIRTFFKAEPAKPVEGKVVYTCPMHPEVVSDQPGKCPKCGMTLIPKKLGPPPTPQH